MRLVKGGDVMNTDNKNVIRAYMQSGYVEEKEEKKEPAAKEPAPAKKAKASTPKK